MRRCLVLLAALTIPAFGSAAPIFTPGGGIASSRLNPTYQIGQDGIAKFINLDPATMLGGQPISVVLSQLGQNATGLATETNRALAAEKAASDTISTTQTTANAALKNTFDLLTTLNANFLLKAGVNAPTASGIIGLAGLDANGAVTAPVNTTGSAWGQSYIGGGFIPAGNGYTARPSFSSGWNNGDPFLYPNTTLVGGHTDHDDGYLKVTGSPWSMSDSGGAIAAIYDTIGDQGTGRNGCGNDDGCSLYVGSQITPFRIEAGSQVTRDDSTPRTVALTGSTVTITPALSTAQIRLLKQWMRVYANYDAPGGNAAGGSYWTNWNGQTLTTATFTPNVYYGYVASWTQGTDYTVLNIVSDPDGRAAGWRTEASAATVTTAPGQNSGDLIDADSASPTWTYRTPSVFIGGAYKKFNMNQTVACLTTEVDTLTRQCEANEIDLWGGSTASGVRGRTLHGLTISYGGDQPADGSYNLALAGGNSNLLVMAPNWYATAVQSDPLYVGPLEGPSRDVSGGPTTAVIASLASSTNTGGQTFSNFTYIRPMWWAQRFATDPGSTTDYANETISYGVSVGAGRGQLGTIQERIELNPQAYKNGIGLCGYNACAYVDSHGKIVSGGDILTGNGAALYTVDPNGSNAAYAYSDSTYQMNIAFNSQAGTSASYSGAQGAPGLHLKGALLADGNVSVAAGKSLGLNDSDGVMGGYQYLVDATSTTGPVLHQVVANKNGLAGTFYVDGALTTGGAAKLASLETVGTAVFDSAITVSGDINLAAGKSVNMCDSATPSLCSYFHSTSYANAKISPYTGNYGGAFVAGSFTLNSLPTADDDGAQVWCSDCKVNGVVGVPVWWHASVSGWRDSTNAALVAQ
ncbi:hypothetical protein [Gluconobacter frateurii]|nr:hypothetical protein [Gluconobacter frateurii]GLP91925.1 hypothetical protein GCM10007868_30000 [Gluconobacter frateurii]